MRRSGAIKENNGNALRVRRNRKALFVTMILMGISLLGLIWKVKSSELSSTNNGDISASSTVHHPRSVRHRRHGNLQNQVNKRQYTEAEKMDLVLTGQVHLVDIDHISSSAYPHESPIGHFCQVDWDKYKNDPTSYPFFRDLVHSSTNCTTDKFSLNLYPLVQQAKEYDATHPHTIKSLPPRGFVFNEGRCGSTLVANSLQIMSNKSRVYSEGTPILNSLTACGLNGSECPPGRAQQLFQDVVYLIGRTNNMQEEDLFIKVHYEGSKYIDVATQAFPSTPWIFLYRDPIQVMMSQLAKENSCVKKRHHIPEWSYEFLREKKLQFESLSPVQVCAFYLQSLCESAFRAIQESNGNGLGLNYNDNLVEKLISTVLPNHFHIPITIDHQRRIEEVNTKYSKGTNSHPKKGTWKEDSATKDEKASKHIRKTCDQFLYPSFQKLVKVSV